MAGKVTSRTGGDRLSVWDEVTRRHWASRGSFEVAWRMFRKSGHCDGCAGCFGSGAMSKDEPRTSGINLA